MKTVTHNLKNNLKAGKQTFIFTLCIKFMRRRYNSEVKVLKSCSARLLYTFVCGLIPNGARFC
jgi:hypothetical protein